MLKHIAFLLLVLKGVDAVGCNIPVFRYALERWSPDDCELVVFHDQPFSEVQRQMLARVKSAAIANGGTANIEVSSWNIHEAIDNSLAGILEGIQSDSAATLPQAVVRCSVGNGRNVTYWQGTLQALTESGILDSPVRRELSQRLLSGDAIVWLMVNSSDQERNQAVKATLQEQLNRLEKELPLPEGIGLPGSELYANVPLLMKFSVLELDADDPQEQALIRLFSGLEPNSLAHGEPLIVPVFGRGRALEVIPASLIDGGLVEDLTLFLSGACSCQVKERNPGFDLLLSTDWDSQLFDEDRPLPPSDLMASSEADGEPEYVLIPAGKPQKSPAPSSPTRTTESAIKSNRQTDPASDLEPQSSSAVAWLFVPLIAIMVAIVVTRSLGR